MDAFALNGQYEATIAFTSEPSLCEICRKKPIYKSTYSPSRGTIQVCKACSYGENRVVSGLKKTGRNDPCPCGSGRKFKRCCLGGLGNACD